MVETDGAPHVSKAIPVNVDPDATVELVAAGETEFGAVVAMPLGPVVAVKEGVGAWMEGADDSTVEASTLSTAELSLPHVASSSTD
jgi:hypothetical protein